MEEGFPLEKNGRITFLKQAEALSPLDPGYLGLGFLSVVIQCLSRSSGMNGS